MSKAKIMSRRARAIACIKVAGATGDLKALTRLIIESRISPEAARRYYLEGQALGDFIKRRDEEKAARAEGVVIITVAATQEEAELLDDYFVLGVELAKQLAATEGHPSAEANTKLIRVLTELQKATSEARKKG